MAIITKSYGERSNFTPFVPSTKAKDNFEAVRSVFEWLMIQQAVSRRLKIDLTSERDLIVVDLKRPLPVCEIEVKDPLKKIMDLVTGLVTSGEIGSADQFFALVSGRLDSRKKNIIEWKKVDISMISAKQRLYGGDYSTAKAVILKYWEIVQDCPILDLNMRVRESWEPSFLELINTTVSIVSDEEDFHHVTERINDFWVDPSVCMLDRECCLYQHLLPIKEYCIIQMHLIKDTVVKARLRGLLPFDRIPEKNQFDDAIYAAFGIWRDIENKIYFSKTDISSIAENFNRVCPKIEEIE